MFYYAFSVIDTRNEKSFFCPPQKYVKTQGTFYTTIFQNKFTLQHIKINIYIQKTKFTSHEHLLNLVFSRNANKTHTDQSMLRSSRLEVFCKKGVFRNLTKFTGKLLCQSLFFNKVAGWGCNLIKKETLAQVFFSEFCEISQKNSFYRTSQAAASTLSEMERRCCCVLWNKCFERSQHFTWSPQ